MSSDDYNCGALWQRIQSSSLKGYSHGWRIYNMDEVFTKPLAKTYRYYFFESIVARFMREAIIVSFI